MVSEYFDFAITFAGPGFGRRDERILSAMLNTPKVYQNHPSTILFIGRAQSINTMTKEGYTHYRAEGATCDLEGGSRSERDEHS